MLQTNPQVPPKPVTGGTGTRRAARAGGAPSLLAPRRHEYASAPAVGEPGAGLGLLLDSPVSMHPLERKGKRQGRKLKLQVGQPAAGLF